MFSVISDDNLRNLDITVNDHFCGHISDARANGTSKDITCPVPLTGTLLKIQKMETSVLNIAEVQPIFISDGCWEVLMWALLQE